MVGITTITDPAGKTFTYEYDHANRLYQIKDSDGNIMEHMSIELLHYKSLY